MVLFSLTDEDWDSPLLVQVLVDLLHFSVAHVQQQSERVEQLGALSATRPRGMEAVPAA